MIILMGPPDAATEQRLSYRGAFCSHFSGVPVVGPLTPAGKSEPIEKLTDKQKTELYEYIKKKRNERCSRPVVLIL